MRKPTSFILTLAMVISICFGSLGSVYAAPEIGVSSSVKVLSACTWEEIGEYVAQAEAGTLTLSDYWSVGDTKSVTLTTGETIELQIADFNHDTFDDGVTAPVTFVMKDCLNTGAGMAASSYNDGGYPASDMKTFVETNIYEKLPADLKAIVAPVKKKCYTTYHDANSLSEASYKVWLLSEMEVFGTNKHTVGTGEGTKYPIFTDDMSRKKMAEGYDNSFWWLRSCVSTSRNAFVVVREGVVSTYATRHDAGVVAGLCIRGTDNDIDVSVPEKISFAADDSGAFDTSFTLKNNNSTKGIETILSAKAYGDWKLVAGTTNFDIMGSNQKKFSLMVTPQTGSNVDLSKETYQFDTTAGGSTGITLKGKTGPVSENVVSERCVTVSLFIKEK